MIIEAYKKIGIARKMIPLNNREVKLVNNVIRTPSS
jgi:helix-turn-helix protein